MTDYTEFLKNPNSLYRLLSVADVEDLNMLVDYITDKGEGRLTLDSDICKKLVSCKNKNFYSAGDREVIRREILLFGGNTLANAYRDLRGRLSFGGVLDSILPDASNIIEYEIVARDVAKHLKATYGEKDNNIAVESAILFVIFKQAYDNMNESERKQTLMDLGVTNISMVGSALSAVGIAAGRAGGFMTYRLAVIVANAIAKAILGRGLTFAGNAAITRLMGIALGPVGIALTGLWTIADLASPASRVTVPCVIQIAYMRQKALQAASTITCLKCKTANLLDAKFCVECGTKTSANET